MPHHFQISDAIARPQVFMLFDTDAAFQMIRNNRDATLRVIGNGNGAGNTLNIIHQQGFFDQALPIESSRDPSRPSRSLAYGLLEKRKIPVLVVRYFYRDKKLLTCRPR